MPITNTLTVKTEVFEGPLELLLELIEKHKLLINDISLSSVTDEYVARVNAMQELPVGEAAEFIALAATLLLIKSRSLLPNLELTDEESRDIKELQYRLALYQLLKEASRGLVYSLQTPLLWEGETPEPEALFVPDKSLSVESLRATAQILIEGFPQGLTLPSVGVKKMLSLEETIERLSAHISSALRLSFREFTRSGSAAPQEERHGIIVSFLALLELVKQGTIKANQEKKYGDITLEAKV